MSVFIRLLLPIKFRLIGVSVTNIALHLAQKPLLVRFILNALYKYVLSKPEHIIAQSAGMVEELLHHYHVPEEKVTVIYPPLQEKFFHSKQAVHTGKKILFIGRLDDGKDPLIALGIFAQLHTADATLEFVGEGKLEAELKQRVSELGLEAKVHFAGRQEDVLPSLQKADVLILTSKYEGFGMVLAESIACGVPVLSFDCPTGPAEIIIDEVNGYLIPLGNTEMFIEKLDLSLTREWNRKDIAATAEKFHPDRVIECYVGVMRKCYGPLT